MMTATAVYRYPIVGNIMLRQPADQPWTDTTIIVEMLVSASDATIGIGDLMPAVE